ncbi:hypothetical protein GCM10009733_040280 [Nonomuraea maheshkhaliensis]|uniref:Uncharacterized protein n=1 Tax=Nonomuraea maheshkhaliensis TaxID=419590 RepID=A0ABN2FBA2_9ACTN
MNPGSAENTTTAAGGFLAISIDDSSIHHYRDVGELLRDPHGGDTAIECFDRDGFRLVFELNGRGQPVAARRTAEAPDHQELARRIGSVIGKSRARLRAADHDDLPDVLQELGTLASAPYAESFEALRRPPYGHPPLEDPHDPNDGDWFHNCFTHGKCF